ncbi:putative carboxypeptidase [Aspergillus cristatus]|uniref:Putative carboxypeptidase n=1 Tax=Aspergillus cristatus TaxID=573508 RepID=A0A1E3BRC1_ASPCR|nr:putative carboxypeptidase [Aspergillus cristatus]
MRFHVPVVCLASLAAASPHIQLQSPLSLSSSSDNSGVMGSLDDIINASPFLSFHRDLVQIESISGNESHVGEFIVNFLEERDFTVTKQPVGDDRFNILAYPASRSHPEILLTSHIDTVPPFIPYSLSRIDNTSSNDKKNIRIAGRGSVDAKGSVAAQVFAALDILKHDPSAPIGLLFVVGEEVGGNGMQAFSKSPSFNPSPSPYHTYIFGEPTELSLVAGHKGMLGFEIVAKGQAAHSGYPWLGQSAVSAILPALLRVDQLGESIPFEKGGLPSSKKYGKTTVNIGRVEGGVTTNVVPAAARADVAVRLAAGTPDEAREIIRRAISNATGDDENVYPDFGARLEAYSPQDMDTDVEGFEVITVNYGTDVPNLVVHPNRDGKQVKRYLYGPGTIFVAHGDHEALTIADLEEAVNGYRKLVEASLRR